MALKNGDLLHNRYRILDLMGEEGIEAVYRAVDEKLDVSVTIKERINYTDEAFQQFQQTARVLASLRHPNLALLFDYFSIEGQGQYLVNEYIDGGNLQEWLSKDERPTEMEGLQIGIAICNALIYLHSQMPPVLHNKIKPINIKFNAFGEIILVALGDVDSASTHQMVPSSLQASELRFSPPEQFGGDALDHRSDIFSLGATLYTALTGYPPENSLSRLIGKEQLSPLRSYQPNLTRLTATVVEKALRLHLEDRWQSATEMKGALIAARDALLPEKQQETRLPPLDQTSISVTSLQKRSKLWERLWAGRTKLTNWFSQRDPVWSIFGAIIILLGVFIWLAFQKPPGLQSLFLADRPSAPALMLTNASSKSAEPPLKFEEPGSQPTLAPLSENQGATMVEPEISPIPTPIGGGGGHIAFVSDRLGVPQIFLVDVLSGSVTQLTGLEDGACQPNWSPTGEKIVFTSPCPSKRRSYPGSRLAIIDVDSGIITSLPASLEGDFDPAWSPDGEWIAHTTLINGRSQVVKLNLHDLKTVRLSQERYPDSSPAWSPDGKQLAFVRLRGVPQIWLMDADGENQEQFTRSGVIDNTSPAWYYDGSLILFSQSLREGSPSRQIYGMRIEDIGQAEEYVIIPRGRLDYIPLMDHVNVSPDGYWLAFDYWYFDVLSDIYIMTFPGADLKQLTHHPGQDYDPVWSP
ncbi:MAG: protein kinase [Chloroflexi bacterium]|nr:protein kinase [Chloroflexota bacterium]